MNAMCFLVRRYCIGYSYLCERVVERMVCVEGLTSIVRKGHLIGVRSRPEDERLQQVAAQLCLQAIVAAKSGS